jgi:DNA polymerase-3 subunit delta'
VNWGILGHDWAVALLRQGLGTGRMAHAYLVCGPPHIGKTSLALALAKALNCEEPHPPCGQCRSCLRIAQHKHPDVRLITGDGSADSIKIDQIRALQREAVLSPYEGKHRVYVLRGMDRATMEAANCLLKTLEEPPGQVVLILTAVRAEALPPTVVSRCQRIDLRPTSCEVVETALRDRGVPASQAHLLARLSAGRVGWALGASQDSGMLEKRKHDLDRLVDLLSAGRVERLDFASRVSRDPGGSRRAIELWLGWWRDMLLLCGAAGGYLINVDRREELESLAGQTTLAEAWAALEALQATAAQLEAHVNARLAWEGLLLKLPRWPHAGSSQSSTGTTERKLPER